jgi:hypothetical protein
LTEIKKKIHGYCLTSASPTTATTGCCFGLHPNNVRRCWKPSVRQLLIVMGLGRIWKYYLIFLKKYFKKTRFKVACSIVVAIAFQCIFHSKIYQNITIIF